MRKEKKIVLLKKAFEIAKNRGLFKLTKKELGENCGLTLAATSYYFKYMRDLRREVSDYAASLGVELREI